MSWHALDVWDFNVMPELFQAMQMVYTYFQWDDLDKTLRREGFATCYFVFPLTAFMGFRVLI